VIAELLAVMAMAAPATEQQACPVTRSTLPSHRYGTRRLWTTLSASGVLQVQRNTDGSIGTKLFWMPDRDRNLQLVVQGRRLDAPGRMRVLAVSWGYSYTSSGRGRGSWASAVAFPKAGCWRLTARAGPTTLSYVVKVVPE
jgi:hypothetical protein